MPPWVHVSHCRFLGSAVAQLTQLKQFFCEDALCLHTGASCLPGPLPTVPVTVDSGAVGSCQQSRQERAKVQSWYFYNWVNYFVISTCLRGRAHLLCHPAPDHLLHAGKPAFLQAWSWR